MNEIVMLGNNSPKIFDWGKIKDFGTEQEVKVAVAEAFNHYIKKVAKESQ